MEIAYRFAFLGGLILIAIGLTYNPLSKEISSISTTLGVMMSLAPQLFKSPPSVAFSKATGGNTFSTLSPQQDTHPNAYSSSGVAILIGGLLTSVIVLGSLIIHRSLLISVFQLLQGAAMIFGLPGFYAKLGNRAGKLGAVGVIILLGGWIILMCLDIFQLANFSAGPLVRALSGIQFYSGTIGSILLGISMIRSAVYPRWTGVALLLAASVYLMMWTLPIAYTNVVGISSVLLPLIISVVYIRCAFSLLVPDREVAIPI